MPVTRRVPAPVRACIAALPLAALAVAAPAADGARLYYAVSSSPGAKVFSVDIASGVAAPTATLELTTSCSGGSWPGITGLVVNSTTSIAGPDMTWAGESRWDGASCTSTPSNSHGYVGTRVAGTITDEVHAGDRAAGNAFTGLGMDPGTGLLLVTANVASTWGTGPGATPFTGTCTTYCLGTGLVTGGSMRVQSAGAAPVAPLVSGTIGYYLRGAGSGAGTVRRATGLSSSSDATIAITTSTFALTGAGATSQQWGMAIAPGASTAYLANAADGSVSAVATGSSSGPAPSAFTSFTSSFASAVLSDGSLVVAGGPLAGAAGQVRVTGGALAGTYTPTITSGGPPTPGITALWVVEPPAELGPPAISGGTTLGSTLTCVDALWADDLPLSRVSREPTSTRTYAWARDGVAISGATTPTHVADAYGTYTCSVTAANAGGSTTATATQAVPDPTPPPAPAPEAGTAGSTPVGSASGAVPAAPSAVSARRAGSGAVQVSWAATAGATGYRATASPGGRSCTATVTRCTITGLTNGRHYTFAVQAIGAAGDGPSSSPAVRAHSYSGLRVRWARSGTGMLATWPVARGARQQVIAVTRAGRTTTRRCAVRAGTARCTVTLRRGRNVVTTGALGATGAFIARANRTVTVR